MSIALKSLSPRFSSAGLRAMVVSSRHIGGRTDGSTAVDWSERERAAEGRFAHEREIQTLKALKHRIERQEMDLEVDLELIDREMEAVIKQKEADLARMEEHRGGAL